VGLVSWSVRLGDSPLVAITDQDTVGYAFIRHNLNYIESPESLDPFWAKLYKQRTEKGRVLHILHLGDSHIQGDFMTREVRNRMQAAFGNAGRGFVFPYRVAGTNGPGDYQSASEGRWVVRNRLRDHTAESQVGLSGYALESEQGSAGLTLRMLPESGNFSKVYIFSADMEANAGALLVYDPDTGQEAELLISGDCYGIYFFSQPVSQALVGRRPGYAGSRLCIDGFSLENELSGVLYHSIGVNGATFSNFTRAGRFWSEMVAIYPDLIILSFGTNEAQTSAGVQDLYNQIDRFMQQLKQTCPNAGVLLTTPADSFLKGKAPNPHLETAREAIRAYASDHGYACWDLYSIGGGASSAISWRDHGLLSHDKVHFSKAGYTAQGKLLYTGLVQGYNEWVASQR